MAITLNHQTPTQFAARVRARFLASEREEACRIATRIMNWIDDGDVTDTQMRNAFNLTVNQWNTLKAKLTDMRTHYQAVLAAKGE